MLKNPSLRKKLISAKENIPRPIVYPDKDAFETLACIGKVDTTNLQNGLGFQPQVSFKEGMRKTLLWVKWANLNCN